MGELFKHCKFTLTESVAENDYSLLKNITKLGFKIANIQPLDIEGSSTTQDAILSLMDLLNKYIVPYANGKVITNVQMLESNNKSSSLNSQNLKSDLKEREQGSDMDDIELKVKDLLEKENPDHDESLELNEETVLQHNVVENFSKNSSLASSERDFNQMYLEDGIYVCTGLHSDIKVHIYKAKMSTLSGVDAVVSAETNSCFQKELEESKILERKYRTSEIIVTREVDSLVPHVLHIVEPSQDLQAAQGGEVDYIRQTVLQCLIEGGSQGFSSLALPSIAVGNNESTPMQKHFKSYVEAAKHFDCYKKHWKNSLQEIHFIDMDDKVIKLIQTCFMEEWMKPRDADLCSTDFGFCDRLLGLQGTSTSRCEQSEGHDFSFAELHISSKEKHKNCAGACSDYPGKQKDDQQAHPLTSSRSISPPAKGATEESDSCIDEETACPICMENNLSLLKLPCCEEFLYTSCKIKVQACPYCRKAFGVLRGDQPDGRMNVRYLSYDCADGYENSKVWEIEYFFPDGLQQDCHPTPGMKYPSVTRKAYLPANDDGFQVLLLLRLAFLRRLTFTIGTSVTMKKDNVITWNDIHHKTSLHGGSFGFPDPEYLSRVSEELDGREVRLQNMTSKEQKAIKKFKDKLIKFKRFEDI